MNFLSVNNMISDLLKIGASLTEKQLLTLKWRLSKEGQKNYTQEETNKFYEALHKGDTSVIDTIRKEKQNKIEELENKLKLV